jgi:poly(3-hydroxybutyrate) depolymerase
MAFNLKRHAARLAAASLALAFFTNAHAQVTAGPGTWSSNQTWAADSVNGGNLTGYFYWPSTQPTLAGKRALVLVLHGCAQTASGDVIDSTSDKGFNWKTVADQYGAIILAPNATGNVSGSHCWDYSRTNHSRTTGHEGVLLDLIQRFVGNAQYAIDPKQVYVAGLSSGGGETMVLACLAPDIFAGAGINAGPPPGTTTLQIGSVPSGYTATTAANNCKALAGSNTSSFSTQIAGVIWGTSDYTVSQQYGPMDAQAMRLSYGGTYTKGTTTTVATGGSNVPYTDANGKLRTSEITVTGMGHAWPAGTGGQNSNYVDATHVNYPSFVMDFWFKNNLRVARVAPPTVNSCSASVSGTTATISGTGSDTAGTISSYRVTLSGPTAVNDAAAGSGASFSKAYANLANGYYTGTVTATDSGTGLTSSAGAAATKRPGGRQHDVEQRDLELERGQRRQRLQRLPQRQPRERQPRHEHELHRRQPGRQHHLQLPGVVDGQQRRERPVQRGKCHHEVELDLHHDHLQQLRPRAGRARARQRRLCAGEWLEPEYGAGQYLLHGDAGPDLGRLLRDRELPLS